MDNVVTLNQLLNIGNTIKENADRNAEYNELLSDHVCKQYNIIDIKDKLQLLFSSFKSARYLYDFPLENNIAVSANYEYREGSPQRSTSSQIENAVSRYIDKQLLTTDIYHSIVKASYKLTDDEVVYLVNTFLVHKSEDDISELIGISKTYLQKIKRSCILKMWTELEKYCKADE